MHVIDCDHHQDVHDVVTVEHQVQLPRKPSLRDVDSADVSTEDGEEILEDDMEGGVGSTATIGTESESKAEDPDDEWCSESESSSPDSLDSHGLVETEDADSEIQEQQQSLGVLVKTVDCSADGDQSSQSLSEPDSQQINLQQERVNCQPLDNVD